MNPPDRATLGKMQNPVRGLLHGSAAVAAVFGGYLLILRADTWPSRIALMIFVLGMVALYTTSSLYHSIPWRERWKKRMQRVDHAMIFVLIAGTYTPAAAFTLDGLWRSVTLTAVWAVALVGIGQQSFFPKERNTFGIALMTALGWTAVALMVPIARSAGVGAVVLVAAGGILYTVGMVIVVTGRPKLWPRVFSAHEVFHVLVVAASALHFTATWRYLVPVA
jgi:hemolysin III